MKVVDGSSSDGESGTDPDDEAILDEEKDSDEDDASDVESNLFSHTNDDEENGSEDESEDEEGEDDRDGGSEGVQDVEAKRREELKKLITEEQRWVSPDKNKRSLIASQKRCCKYFQSCQGRY